MTQIHFAAREELEDAALYYAKISPELAEKFLLDYEQTLSFIEAMPLAWAVYYSDLRRLNFKIFPCSIIYSHSNNGITVFAIQHNNREPFYWRNRI